jgi:hypothetical protein
MANLNEIISYLQGCYEIKSKSLVKKGTEGLQRFAICSRKNPTKNKPPKYLIDTSSKKAEYISSLYITEHKDKYVIELDGVYFDVTKTDATYQIVHKKE